ncbi:hypothetical protein [Rhodococcus qingshengii]|uniref:hypothetical protein n=1 Tax=Rhodococcus qingshengii TaxID=334542 RepID=UPI0022B50771|nr:hypothetical protein [Rhodococcus qingshengii]MCZ4615204.1 hypothetical protein [Rhodococcus qingshengii]
MIIQPGMPFPAMNEAASWFASLDSATRRVLFSAPYADVPTEFVSEILSKGHKLAEPWFVGAEETDSFKLPEEIADYVDGLLEELQLWWAKLPSRLRLAWAEVGSEPLPEFLQPSRAQVFPLIHGDDAHLYADPQLTDFIAVAAA